MLSSNSGTIKGGKMPRLQRVPEHLLPCSATLLRHIGWAVGTVLFYVASPGYSTYPTS